MAQPILWCQHAKAQRERTRVVGGKKVTEKVPQHGHDGKDADYDKPYSEQRVELSGFVYANF